MAVRHSLCVALGLGVGLGWTTTACAASPTEPRSISSGADAGDSTEDLEHSGEESGSPEKHGGTEKSWPDEREPDRSRPLPEIRVRHVGMHIGGGRNTSEEKRPFFQAIEKNTQDLLLCYRLVDRPERGGTFGADLYVKTRGGNPEVRRMRQKLGGQEFAECMKEALQALHFPAVERPTMVSYSLRFDVFEPQANEASHR